MKRLIEYTVFSGFVTAWRFATCPTRRSPVLVIATTEGVVRPPSWFGITTGSPPCITATTELVVPRSIPIILLIADFPPESLGRHWLARVPYRKVFYTLSVSLSSILIICICIVCSALREVCSLPPSSAPFFCKLIYFSYFPRRTLIFSKLWVGFLY